MFDIDKVGALRMGHITQLVLTLYGARFSYVAITNLRKYEETTKKAAKWSKEVEKQLNETRTTQTLGAAALFLSFLSALTLITLSKYLHSYLALGISPATLIMILVMRHRIKMYWTPYKAEDGKDVGARVPLPFMEDYNEAQFMTERLLEVLQYLEYSWLGTSVFASLGYRL